jgi:acetolactate synthase-1/2/3 large subunit
VELAIHGDVGAVTKQLAKEAEQHRWSEHPMLAELESTRASQMRTLEGKASDDVPLHSMSVHRALAPMLDGDTSLVFEGSDFAFYGAAYHPSEKLHRWFTTGTLGMLGWGIPYGLGVQAATPRSRVVVLSGDGAFGFNGMELDTAVRNNLPVVVVVGSDGVWGIDYHQQVELYGRAVATELLPVRYDKVAEALGAHGEYVTEGRQLSPALQRAFASGKPAVVNVKTAPSPSPLTEYIIRVKGGADAT